MKSGTHSARLELVMKRFALVCALLASVFPTATVVALDQPALDPAARPIAKFDDTLIGCMRDAKQLGVSGRYDKLRPVIERTFDMPEMTGAAIGQSFATLPSTEQQALVESFTRMTAATYAHEFNDYNGQSFSLDDKVAVRGDRKLVQTTLVSPGDKSHAFAYVMHRVGRDWKVVDILLDGYVSQIATKRSDFSATVGSAGPEGLRAKLDSISTGLLSSPSARS